MDDLCREYAKMDWLLEQENAQMKKLKSTKNQ